MTVTEMNAVVVTEVGASPSVGRRPRPDLATAVPAGFPIEGPQSTPHGHSAGPTSLIEVTYAAVNPIDLHIASGTFFQGVPEVPYIPGVEGVGRIAASSTYADGTRVRFELGHAGYGSDGAMAEFAVAYDAGLVPLPDGVNDADACAVGVVAITAGRALDLADLKPGETVVVLGATGSVGYVAVQLARLRGAGRVVAAGRREDRLARAMELGADAAVSLDLPPAQQAGALREACEGGTDVIIDPLWGQPAMAALSAGNFGVRLVNFGQAASSAVEFSSVPLRNNRATIRGISTSMDDFDVRRQRCAEAIDYLAAGKLTVDYDVYELGRLQEAWQPQSTAPGRKRLLRILPASG